ncbi:Low affinity iron permease-domain-containing protein [Halenospora varia]|nr:Low affinity iron permease-domain-containing protein [Halenospora varia]
MQRAFKILCALGAREEIEGTAPTQVVPNVESDEKEKDVEDSVENVNTYTVLAKPRLLDRWLDKVVEVSGSESVYFTIIVALLVWAFLGIPFGRSNTWQVTISDAQAIVNMVFDAFLMRQQLNSHDSLVNVAACLRSRSTSNKRMLKQLIGSGKYEKVEPTRFQELQQTTFASELPAENWLGRLSTALSTFMGHIATVFGFWVCIFIWIGFGKYCDWSNTWQLYINSATSALMVFILGFLANIRERHTKYMTKCLESIWEVDSALELRLRTITGDTMENAPIVIPAAKRSRIQRGIDYYADLVGTLVGIAILIFVIIVWVAIGPALHFDANWWLLIGSYAGLIGLNDGFVLRNVCTVLGDFDNEQFTQVEYEDMDMLAVIGVEKLKEERVADNSFTCRISVRVGDICSHELTVVLGAITIIGLIIGASAMGWSVTGQLLCNVPPSIIESFFTMILITGHNIGDAKRRVDLYNIYLRRLKLVSYVDTLDKVEQLEKAEVQDQVDEVVEIEE